MRQGNEGKGKENGLVVFLRSCIETMGWSIVLTVFFVGGMLAFGLMANILSGLFT